MHTVEDNLDEVEFFRTLQQMDKDGDTDQYIRYGVGYLEIDDDFLDSVNGVCTALYRETGELLYGENPIAGFEPESFADGETRIVRARGEKYYVFDRRLESPGLRALWLRGVVAESRGDAPLYFVVRVCLWFLGAVALIAVRRRNADRPAGASPDSGYVARGGANRRRERPEAARARVARRGRAVPAGRNV